MTAPSGMYRPSPCPRPSLDIATAEGRANQARIDSFAADLLDDIAAFRRAKQRRFVSYAIDRGMDLAEAEALAGEILGDA